MTHHVYRWHSHPDPRLRDSKDTIEAHQWRVVELCRDLAARIGHLLHDSDLLRAARYHDNAEKVLGDWPGPAKDRFPALAAAYAKAELQVLTEMGHTWTLTRREADMLTLCDKLDAQMWAMYCGVDGPEWKAARVKLRRRAAQISLSVLVWTDEHLTRSRVTA